MATKVKSTISAASALAYLRPEGLKFLRGLEKNNDREWFNERKAVYEAELKEPMLAIVRKITDAMMEFAPHHVRPAEKSLFRIYRDTRFSNNKLPYKTHVAAWWSAHGHGEDFRRGLLLPGKPQGRGDCRGRVHAGEGPAGGDPALAAGDHHDAFRKVLSKPAIRKTFKEFEGEALTRPPKGFPCEHPAMDLIKCKQWGLSTTLPAETALETDFAADADQAFQAAGADGGCA